MACLSAKHAVGRVSREILRLLTSIQDRLLLTRPSDKVLCDAVGEGWLAGWLARPVANDSADSCDLLITQCPREGGRGGGRLVGIGCRLQMSRSSQRSPPPSRPLLVYLSVGKTVRPSSPVSWAGKSKQLAPGGPFELYTRVPK